MNKGFTPFNYSLVALSIGTALSAGVVSTAHAQATQAREAQIERIEVTATRRSGDIQEVPLNITALTADVLAEQNIGQLEDVARWVPGLTVVDQGGRNDSPIIVRGLNTNSSGPGSNGGTVATYFGEIPLFINMRLNDVERVEVLIGPQGTLYGAGTLGGAIRYLPKAVDLEFTTGKVYGDVYNMSESDDVGSEVGGVVNIPLIDDTLGVRMSFNFLRDPGFIDYNYVVREGGVSLPDPDWDDPQAVEQNLRRVEDANGEDTFTGRIAVRWVPTDWLDGTLTYFYQKQDVDGRSIVHHDVLADSNRLSGRVGEYESAYRYEEPREKIDELLSLELKADLGFAELVSATGSSSFEADGQRDQTDLLIRLNFSYEEFPAFSAFTRELDNADIFTQEVRLVSTTESDFSWIVGAFYNKIESDGRSSEFTPGFDQFVLDVFETGGNPRPDSLEYLSVSDSEVTESAIFGEVTYEINDRWDVTAGFRAYEYDVTSRSAIDLPLFRSAFEGDPSDSIILDFQQTSADDSGTLFKFNTSYQFTDDVMGYFTVSEGFRIGGSNGVGACPPDVDETPTQEVCALPNEEVFVADTTTNYEIGIKSTWFKNKFHFNAAVFNIDWDDAQVSGATVNGQQPITANAGGANSKGVEISTRAVLSDSLTAYATYSYTQAELTADAPFLFAVVDEQGTPLQDFYDGKDGDRLSGAPENQFSVGLKYTTEIFDDKLLDVNYGLTAQSDVYSKVGLRADGESIPGFALSNINATVSDDDWAVTFYIDNLFDKYAHSSVRRDQADIGLAEFDSQEPNRVDLLRNYGRFLITPRQIGIKFTYNFEL
ncbi:TonB-dependent receptor [Alteromonas oceanisediminis]|uniref:TonB-dependent receptor n=1 Tax=Alteromonas oceanisediminis TaxID=2836180 RepID=UPI001BDA965C|nr:TonB-dependent receptor [Alteromonas oceanisediminis]MBT0586053.1 TonB-dependent receptor [Alteromonas oceanisediminis]